MAKTVTPLTDTQIKKAKGKEKEYNLSDGSGLSIRIKPNNSKYWIFNYSRPYSKKRANLSLGVYPEVSLKAARELRSKYRELLAKNIDPQEHKAENNRAQKALIENTLEVTALKWFEIKKTTVTKSYGEDIWRSLNNHIFPELGKFPIHKLQAPQVINVLKPISSKGNHETVRRLCQRLNEIMTWCLNTGVIEQNPLAGIKHAFEAPKEKNFPSLRPDELPELMRAIYSASIKLTTRCLIEWQLHTMVRPSEAAGAKWSEIDIETNLWTIPAERMKKNKSHIVPLTTQALKILETMKTISGHREFVFPADRDPKRHTNSQTANAALKRMGFGKRLVSHGMRALASTTLNEQGFIADVIEAALAHIDSNEVRRAYNRAEYIEQRRDMMNWWSKHISDSTFKQ